ncbi:MAG: LysR family transcriptional regulator [Pseudomonadota bacterium]
MSDQTESLDWALLQSFAAVAENGSLSAAARKTGSSQPTLSRHISQLEAQVGARLLHRVSGGVELTDAGAALVEHVQTMADAAVRFGMVASGKDDDHAGMRGTVRITASQIVATFILPDILTALRAQEPGIDIEIVASDETNNLLRREADIAVRMYRPTQEDVIARKVADLETAMFAAHSYIERRGMPTSLDDILTHDVIGYDRSTLVIDGMKKAGYDVDRDFFAFRSDDQVVCWQMVVAGYGIGFNQRRVGQDDSRVVEIEMAGTVSVLPIWLVAHQELRSTPRVRRVFDHLAEALKAIG